MPDWNIQLREARKLLGMSRAQVADAAELSHESLRSYELGRRRPTREHLLRLLKCLKLKPQDRNLILADAGFATEAAVQPFQEPNVPLKEAVRMVRGRPWPAFLLNSRTEVLAVSGIAWRLFGLPDHDLSGRRSALTLATRRAIAARVDNWDQQVAGMIGAFKAGVPEEPSLDEPGPRLRDVLRHVTGGDPAMMTRFTELWEATPPFQGRMTGLMYASAWKTPAGLIRFRCLISCLNTETGLYAHAWIPADAQSHALFEKAVAQPSDESSTRARRRSPS